MSSGLPDAQSSYLSLQPQSQSSGPLQIVPTKLLALSQNVHRYTWPNHLIKQLTSSQSVYKSDESVLYNHELKGLVLLQVPAQNSRGSHPHPDRWLSCSSPTHLDVLLKHLQQHASITTPSGQSTLVLCCSCLLRLELYMPK